MGEKVEKGETRTLIYCCQEHKTVESFWKEFGISQEPENQPAIPLLGTYLREI